MNIELIDTLWNVNREAMRDIQDDIDELIDTLWNVNAFLKNIINIVL